MSHSEILDVLTMLGAAYPKFKMTPDTVKAYSRLLQDIPIESLKAAALQCATSSEWFPSVYELRRAAVDLRKKADGVPTAFEAWEALVNVTRNRRITTGLDENGYRVMRYEYVWPHPIVERVAQLLGWPHQFPTDNVVADRAHFFKAYDDEVSKLMADAVMLPEVRAYISKNRQLQAGTEIKQLAERMQK